MSRDEIAASEDIALAVQEALQRSGAYRKIKAQIRAQVFQTLEDKTVEMPEQPPDVFLASLLVRDFLSKFKLSNSLNVFCEEMGQPDEMQVDRELIGGELGLNTVGSDDNMPLLLLLVQHLKMHRREFLEQIYSSGQAEPSDD